MKTMVYPTFVLAVVVCCSSLIGLALTGHQRITGHDLSSDSQSTTEQSGTSSDARQNDSAKDHKNVGEETGIQIGKSSIQSRIEFTKLENSHPSNIAHDDPSELVYLGLYHPNEYIRASALSQLKKDDDANLILINTLSDPSPVVRSTTIEKMIEFEDIESPFYATYVEDLIERENDDNVLEKLLGYVSLISLENGNDIILPFLDRADLSRNVLAYAAEILHEDYGLDKTSCKEILNKSPSFEALEYSEKIQLQDNLDEILKQ